MYCEPYDPATLGVAFCHQVTFHFQTYRRLPESTLAKLDLSQMRLLLTPYGVRLLDFASTQRDLVCRVSLKADTSVAVAASKLKGRLSNWLASHEPRLSGRKALAGGYCGYTVGNTTVRAIAGYLEKQGLHHGYLARPLPPVFVATPGEPLQSDRSLETGHSVNCLRYHIVLGTNRRRGVFTEVEGKRMLAAWQRAETEWRGRILKLSVVPNHVHLAVRLHPAVVPVEMVAKLMNCAQEMMLKEFPEVMIRYAQGQLWQNGAYVGSFGDVEGRSIRQFIARWHSAELGKSRRS